MHKVHHSRWHPETDLNCSSLLSFWDRLFRSFKINEKSESIRLGLDRFSAEHFHIVGGLLKTPLEKTARKDRSKH